MKLVASRTDLISLLSNLKSEHLVAQVAIFMITLGVSVELHGVLDHLLFSNLNVIKSN